MNRLNPVLKSIFKTKIVPFSINEERLLNCSFLKANIDSRCVSCSNRRTKSANSNSSIVKEERKGKTEYAPFEAFLKSAVSTKYRIDSEDNSYIAQGEFDGGGRKVFFETYGCQMNVNDTEIAWSILKENGFQRAAYINESDVILVMTCSIREGAEQKIWKRLEYLKHLKNRRKTKNASSSAMKIGILGCMAERLKSKILEKEKLVDIVCGPDAYRDLPKMLSVVKTGQSAVNVQLSLEETYADILPVRISDNSPSAYVSIMRGCDNMCTYCIVPFTRGRERSRPIDSIVEEVKVLSSQGIKEVTLLGQNVNSYRDISESTFYIGNGSEDATKLTKGFKTVYKSKVGGRRFSELLNHVSLIDPEMRIRFTSPHPKDFPDEVIHLIKERANICNQIHLPAQSGNNQVLDAMRRGYTQESYRELLKNIRKIIPDISLSSDFIAGFCGETEEAHHETLSLIRDVKYNFAFCFPYSMRAKTRAYHRLNDDVPEDVKSRRHMELVSVFREEALRINKSQIGQLQLVLIEGESKRSSLDLAGRNDGNSKVIIPNIDIPKSCHSTENIGMKAGDYIVVEISDASSQTLKGIPLYHSSIRSFQNEQRKNQEKIAQSISN